MRAALVLVLVGALTLTGCGRLRDDATAPTTPSPSASEAVTTDDVSDLLDQATDTLDQVNRDLQTGDDAAEKE